MPEFLSVYRLKDFSLYEFILEGSCAHVPDHYILLNGSCVDGYFCCFYFLAVVKKAAKTMTMTMGLHSLLRTYACRCPWKSRAVNTLELVLLAVMRCLMWVLLGRELRSFGRAASTPNQWAISSAPLFLGGADMLLSFIMAATALQVRPQCTSLHVFSNTCHCLLLLLAFRNQ